MQRSILLPILFIIGAVFGCIVYFTTNTGTNNGHELLENWVLTPDDTLVDDPVLVTPNGTAVGCSLPTDGFGSQYLCHMAALAFARHHGRPYYHVGLSPYGMHDCPTVPECVVEGPKFVGMASDPGIHLAPTIHTSTGMSGAFELYCNESCRSELRAFYYSTPKPERDPYCSVAIHVRRGDVLANDSQRTAPNEAFVLLITKYFPGMNVCVISEGGPEDFGELSLLPNVKMLLSLEWRTSFHNFVTAPRLVIDKSGFSYTAGVLNAGEVFYFWKQYWHAAFPHWKFLNVTL